MKNRSTSIGLFALALVAVVLVVFRQRIHFDWASFWHQLRLVSPAHVALAVALIYATFWLRALRWKFFLASTRQVSANALVGPQFIGFTAVSLFGRLADLTRPYLLAKRVDLPVSSQIAVYTVERMFDLGAAAVVFSSALALAPGNLPHRGTYVHVGVLSLAATLTIACFAVFIRIAGVRLAAWCERIFGRVSKPLAEGLSEKILSFRVGLSAITSVRECVVALVLSVLIWAMIGESYVQTAHSFLHTPELADLSYARTMLLFAASLGGSLLQLPVIGWFTQIAVTATSMRQFYGAPIEASTACGALLLIVTNLSIVPAGFLFARLESVSLKQAANASSASEHDTL